MSKKNGSRNGLADRSRLAPVDSDNTQMLRVVIETPTGSRNFLPWVSIFKLSSAASVVP
jgi:hypothetical protein